MKDRYDICAGHENLLSGTDMAEYRDHLKLKDESRNYKARVKDNVKKDPYLSEMLQCLTKWESSLYYERKLNVQNLTVYDYRNGQGHCNVWSEVDAMRGSYEIALCVVSYLNELQNQHVQDVILFSDSCGGTKTFFYAMVCSGNDEILIH